MVLEWSHGKRSCYVWIANQLHTAQRVESHEKRAEFRVARLTHVAPHFDVLVRTKCYTRRQSTSGV